MWFLDVANSHSTSVVGNVDPNMTEVNSISELTVPSSTSSVIVIIFRHIFVKYCRCLVIYLGEIHSDILSNYRNIIFCLAAQRATRFYESLFVYGISMLSLFCWVQVFGGGFYTPGFFLHRESFWAPFKKVPNVP